MYDAILLRHTGVDSRARRHMSHVKAPSIGVLDPDIGDLAAQNGRTACRRIPIKGHLEGGDNDPIVPLRAKPIHVRPIAPAQGQRIAYPRRSIHVRRAPQHVIRCEQRFEACGVPGMHGGRQSRFPGADVLLLSNRDAGLLRTNRRWNRQDQPGHENSP